MIINAQTLQDRLAKILSWWPHTKWQSHFFHTFPKFIVSHAIFISLVYVLSLVSRHHTFQLHHLFKLVKTSL